MLASGPQEDGPLGVSGLRRESRTHNV